MADDSNNSDSTNYDSYGNPKAGILKKLRMPRGAQKQRGDMTPEEQMATPEEGAQETGLVDTAEDMLTQGKENLPPGTKASTLAIPGNVGGMGFSGALQEDSAAAEAAPAFNQFGQRMYRPTKTAATTGFGNGNGYKSDKGVQSIDWSKLSRGK